jgi:zinc transport system permease protein
MLDFLTMLVQYRFLQYALIAGLLAAIVCGVMGTFVVLRRISMVSGGISHAVMGGVGIAYFIHFPVFWGALIFAVLTAIIISLVRERAAQREDTLISALWAIGMAVGVIFMALTPGYNVDLFSFLFGNILMVAPADLIRLSVLAGLVVLVVFFTYRQLLAVSFDPEFARLRGLRVGALSALLLVLVAVTVVILIQAVGLILVIALLTLPAATVALFADTPIRLMAWATLVGLFCNWTGLFAAFQLDLPPGATIILLSGILYITGLIVQMHRKRN